MDFLNYTVKGARSPIVRVRGRTPAKLDKTFSKTRNPRRYSTMLASTLLYNSRSLGAETLRHRDQPRRNRLIII